MADAEERRMQQMFHDFLWNDNITECSTLASNLQGELDLTDDDDDWVGSSDSDADRPKPYVDLAGTVRIKPYVDLAGTVWICYEDPETERFWRHGVAIDGTEVPWRWDDDYSSFEAAMKKALEKLARRKSM